MSKLKWYPRDPSASLTSMMILSLEERGAYNTIMDLLYAHDGEIMDDDRYFSSWLKCDLRVWKRIKNALILHKKIYLKEEMLRSYEVDEGVLRALSRVLSRPHLLPTSKEIKELAPPITITTTTPKTKVINTNNTNSIIRPSDVSEEIWLDWLKHRKLKKASVTKTALNNIINEAKKAGYSLEQALSECCQRGWIGFKADWVLKESGRGQPEKKKNYGERMMEAAAQGVYNYEQSKIKGTQDAEFNDLS